MLSRRRLRRGDAATAARRASRPGLLPAVTARNCRFVAGVVANRAGPTSYRAIPKIGAGRFPSPSGAFLAASKLAGVEPSSAANKLAFRLIRRRQGA